MAAGAAAAAQQQGEGADRRGDQYASNRVTYHVGIPGPTKLSKLQRIAEICEVPSLFLGSAFDILDLDGDGEVDEQELLAAAVTLSVRARLDTAVDACDS